MLSFSHREKFRRARWYALVVLISICSLTINVATRYGSAHNPAPSAAKSLHQSSTHEPSRQRLTNTASTCVQPAATATVLYAPSSSDCIASSGPALPRFFLVSSLYTRPPPSSAFLS
jgi:hypothetical protein